MQLSIREAKARFTEAAAAAARGERVVVTKHGHPFIELVPAKARAGIDWDRLAQVRKAHGVEDVALNLDLEAFNDPAFSRRVLGLEE